MYLEIDEGYFEHPKTLDLCARLDDDKADVFPPRLWKWACRSAKSGKLGKISAFAIEKAVHYKPMDGRCFSALVGAGWIDANEDGTFEIHDWMEATGGAIARMEKKAEENRTRRADAKARHDAAKVEHRGGSVPESYQNRTGTNPSQTRQDKTSPDKTRPEGADPDARACVERLTPPNEPGKPSPRHVVARYLAIRAELVVGAVAGSKGIFQQPSPSDVEKADQWIAAMAVEDCVDIEPAIRLACEHVRDGSQGWGRPEMAKAGFLFGCIVRSWPDLREELHGCAPKIAKPNEKPREVLRFRE